MTPDQPLSIVAIVGRPNVGKSTLFNRILGERKAVVLDTPGVTRDRNYGIAEHLGRRFLLVDTGGYDTAETDPMPLLVREQCLLAIEEADAVVLLVDVQQSESPVDRDVANLLRRTGKPVFVAVNKCDSHRHEDLAGEFYRLGLEPLFAVSAEHNRGISYLLDAVVEALPETPLETPADESPIRIAVVGRQNVGKSTLVNAMCGADRVIASDKPGTTRDAIDTPIQHEGRPYVIVDTAGIRRRGKIERGVEKLSVTSAILSLERCDVALIVLDGSAGVVDQDTHIAGYALEAGRAVILLVNKWDLVEKDHKTADHYVQYLRERLKFLPFAPVLFISAKSGQRVTRIFRTIDTLMPQYRARFETSELNAALQQFLERHTPPVMKGRRLKIKYVTQTRSEPPTFTLFVNNPELMHFSYERYLTNQFRERFGLDSVPVRLRIRRK